MREIRALAVALLVAALGATARADDGEWETSATLGLALLTYPSTASLRPVRPLILPPMSSHCTGCITSGGLDASLAVARGFGPVVRVVVALDASRHPSFGDDLYSAAAGVGTGMRMGSLPLFSHGDVLVGAGRIVGPVGATAAEIQIAIGLDYGLTDHVALGFEGKFIELYGAQPAGDGSRGAWGIHLAYRGR